jgi:hypothetical protein
VEEPTVELTTSELDDALSTLETEAYDRGHREGMETKPTNLEYVDSKDNRAQAGKDEAPKPTDFDEEDSGSILFIGLLALTLGLLSGILKSQSNGSNDSRLNDPPRY